MTRGRAVLAAVSVVGFGVAALLVLRPDDRSHSSARPVATGTRANPGPQTIVTSDFDLLVLRHPASWREFQSEEGPLSSGPAQTIGYLTDQVVNTPQCSISATSTTCHSIVGHLKPGGIVVTIVTTELNPPFKGTTTIAGHPAVVTRSADADCAEDNTGKTYEVDARIQTSTPTKREPFVTRTVVDACVAYPVSAQTRLGIERMLTTARR